MARNFLRTAGKGRTRTAVRIECLEQRQMLTATSEYLPLVEAVPLSEGAPIADPAIVLPSGNANNDAASLLAAGGPGDPALPGFANVARSGNSGTIVYLGAGWALTANHVSLPASISLAGSYYTVIASTVTQLKNPDGSSTDLKMFKVDGRPPLPELYSSYIATAPPSGRVFMIGNGSSAVRNAYWHVDKLSTPWVWTETAQPANPGNNDYGGTVFGSSRSIRWGENLVDDIRVEMTVAGRLIHGFTTEFDSLPYSGQAGLPNEAQAAGGDSGGAVFSQVNGQWVLSGIMIAVSNPLSGQPSNTALYENITLMADLSVYRSQILSIIGVADRQLFYNGSYFDGNDPAANAADDAAIATNKSAYLPGAGVAVPANFSNYVQGINGIMVDLVSTHGQLTADDFIFKVGNNNAPELWTEAPAPSAVVVRPGAGAGGSDRVEITWENRSISNTWLQVTVRGNDALGGFNTNTGLAKSDVFYWGSKVADSGLAAPADRFETTASDSLQVFSVAGSNKPVTDLHDYNRDGMVTAFDSLIVFFHAGSITRIDIPVAAAMAAALAAEEDIASDELSAIVTTLAADAGRPRSPQSEDASHPLFDQVLTQRVAASMRLDLPRLPLVDAPFVEIDHQAPADAADESDDWVLGVPLLG